MVDLNFTDNRWKELREEFFEVQEWAREKIDSHLRKRVFLRTIAADIEGCINLLAYLLVSTPNKLSIAELSILNETQYDLKENGDVKERVKYYSCVSKWRLIVNIMERNLGTRHWKVEFTGNNYSNFKTIFNIRNRITHPKIDSSLEIKDEEMECCIQGYKWFIENYQGICKI